MEQAEELAREATRLLEEAASAEGDAGLAARAHAAVDRLFAAHHQRVHRVCVRFVRDADLAADLTQDVFVTAWRRLGEWRGEGAFFSWLYGIARFTCMNALRRKRELLGEEPVIDELDGGPGALTDLRRHERLVVLGEAMRAALDPLEREVMHLRYHEGLGQTAITGLLGLDGSGARAVLARARRKLGRELERRAADLGEGPSFFAVTR